MPNTVHQNYVRPNATAMSNTSYGRAQTPAILPSQQRQILPQFNINQVNAPAAANMMTPNCHQSQYYNHHPAPNMSVNMNMNMNMNINMNMNMNTNMNINQANYQNVQG